MRHVSPIQLVDNGDKTFTLYYFATPIGHIAPVRYARSEERVWRAVSHTTGQVHYARNKDAARRYLVEAYA